MGRGIEEIEKGDVGRPWEGGLELRRDVADGFPSFRLLLGGACVGVLRGGSALPEIVAEFTWAERLLREVLEEWRRSDGAGLPMAA